MCIYCILPHTHFKFSYSLRFVLIMLIKGDKPIYGSFNNREEIDTVLTKAGRMQLSFKVLVTFYNSKVILYCLYFLIKLFF